MQFVRVALAIFAFVMFSSPAMSAVPNVITHQGFLTDSSGVALSGSTQISFSLYAVDTGGTAIWSETQTAQVNNGVYAVALGSVTPLDPAKIDGDLWLGVTVGTDAEMTPRQQLNSVAFALRAAQADSVPDGAITDAKIAGQISASKIPEISTLQSEVEQLHSSTVSIKSSSPYVDNGDGTVDDPDTGLMWLKAPLQVTSGSGQTNYIGVCVSSTEAGYTDWRMPTRQELRGIYTTVNSNNLDASFSGATGYYRYVYEYLYGSSMFNCLNFGSGYEVNCTNTSQYVRCVRGVNKQYVDNGDGTVTDLDTRLMWLKGPEQVTSGAEQSDYIGACVSSTAAGYTDWRMPTRQELRSIYTTVNSNNVDASFSGATGYYRYVYEYLYGSSMFNCLNFGSGYEANCTNTSQYVRCVRGGE